MSALASRLVGAAVAALGLLGLFMASRALDPGLTLFGLVLFAFATLFDFGLIRRAYDAREREAAVRADAEQIRAAA
jgi:FtsH-binding integral membrane protein